MTQRPTRRPLFTAIILIFSVIILSTLSVRLWGGAKHEKPRTPAALIINQSMTVQDFAAQNNIPPSALKNILALQSKKDLARPLASFAISRQQFLQQVENARALHNEDSSKNWLKIPVKFGLWLAIMLFAFFALRGRHLNPARRKALYFVSVILFGVILGADPSPMGPVKDAIALFGSKGVIYRPRIIALTIFLATVLFANKFICAWGCQFGTLQDLIFRLNRNKKDTGGILRQYKPPFWLTNIIRLGFFIVFTLIALAWATDIIEYIDPFKLFKPAMLTAMGWSFLAIIISASLFIYRPWCHLFCPFGLAAWVVEQFSIFKIKVRADLCTDCGACARACPSLAMDSILNQQKITADCFACGTCIEICPSKAISFSATKNLRPQ